MSQVILICISGTGQDISDAKKNAIDNPLKIAVHCGWQGYDTSSDIEGQYVIYVPGIGTLESEWIIDGVEGIRARLSVSTDTAFSPKRVIERRKLYMREQLEKAQYRRGDTICIVGFSRGAAESRILASHLSEDNIPVRLLCCFDTVTQIGGPDKSKWPDDGLLFENNAVAESVEQAVHLVSIDENRILFPPTLMDHEDRVHEVWFPGVHSDIGGGYAEHGLSDITLGYTVNCLSRIGINVRKPDKTMQNSLPNGIGKEDIVFNPNPLARIHQHKVGIGKRIICVIDGGKPSRIAPLISESVKERMNVDPSYSIGNMFEWDFV